MTPYPFDSGADSPRPGLTSRSLAIPCLSCASRSGEVLEGAISSHPDTSRSASVHRTKGAQHHRMGVDEFLAKLHRLQVTVLDLLPFRHVFRYSFPKLQRKCKFMVIVSIYHRTEKSIDRVVDRRQREELG